MQGAWVQSLGRELKSYMLQCGQKKKKKKSVRARLRRPGYFFTRDKQALVLRMAVRMIDWIYKHKAGGRVWEQADDSW